MTKKVLVIGLGYMGLPMACLLAKGGFQVQGVDIDKKKTEKLERGEVTFDEPGLPALFKSVRKRLTFGTKPAHADAFIVAVPTPVNKKGLIDFRFVKKAVQSIVPVLRDGNLVVIESTVSPGTALRVVRPILEKAKKDYFLAYCPERAFPSRTLYEMASNDRIIGGLDKKSISFARNIYKKFVKGKIFTTDITTAETVKLFENSYRGVNIAFANEVAKLAHAVGVNVWEAIKLANRHPRVNILEPGPGVGGHCIPVDPWFLISTHHKETKLLRLSLIVNEEMGHFVVDLMASHAKKHGLKIKKVGVLGVAYKKNVDDARETPASRIVKYLGELGYEFKCTDPLVKKFHCPLYHQEEVLRWADALILVTDHNAYRRVNFKRDNLKLFVDTRNALSKKQFDKIKGAYVVLLGCGEAREAYYKSN